MTISFKVTNQTIRLSNNDPYALQDIVSGSVGYLHAKFIFSADWEKLVRSAIFVTEDGIAKTVPLENNTCLVPHEVIKAPKIYVGVYGVNLDGDLVEVPTSKCEIKIKDSGIISGDTPDSPTPSEYASIIGIMQQQAIDATRAETAQAAAETAAVQAQSYAKFGTFSLEGNVLVATVEAANDITDIKIDENGELVITIGD